MKKFVSILVLAVMCTTAFGQIQFSEPQNIQALNLTNRADSYTQGTYSKTITLEIELSDVELYKTSQDFDILKIEGLTTTGKAGEPTTYLKSAKVVLKKNARITGIKLIEGNYVELKQKINLAPRPKPVIWMKDAQNDFTLRKDETIYEKDALFPGKTTSFISGQDGQNTIVYVQFFISQYNPVQKQLLLITDARIEISYVIEGAPQEKTGGSRSDAKNIILTVPAFQAAADSLKNLHETLENVTTEVVTTDWINTNYTAAANPTQPGYATITSNPVNNNYDYDLAKKIISYLRDNAAHPNLESITILGDAGMIPPSYYFYQTVIGDDYNDWICSDLFYATPDYDMVLNFEIGRLPATDAAEAQLMFQKLKNWKTNLNASWFNNVQLAGGMPFGRKTLIGEVITLDAINKGYLKGMNIGKNFLSKGTQNTNTVLPYFSNENTGIFYHIDHGSGNEMSLGNTNQISYTDLMGLPAKQKYPVVISIACMNGGYDTELMDNEPFNTRCFAEGVLCSQAGGIVYWGGVRVNAGAPEVSFQANGEMIVGDEPYMAAMLTNVFKAWSEGKLSFGAISKNASETYIQNTGLTEPIDKHTLYEFVLFGDPAFSMLPPGTSSYDNVVFDVNPLPHVPGGGNEPIYYRTNSVSIPVNITGATNSPSVNIGIYDFDMNQFSVSQLVNTNDNTVPFAYEFTPPAEKIYFACYETADFKETRLYFRTKTVNQLPPMACHLFEIQNQSGSSYDLLWSSAKDYDGQIASYSLMEMKNPVAVLDSCNNFEKWENDGFSVSTGGHNSVNCFYSGNEFNQNISIKNMMPVKVNQGDSLRFWRKYDFEENDYVNVEIAEAGQPFTVLTTYTGKNNTWTESTFDLSAFVEKKIIIRVRYVSGQSFTGTGFYIDDISPVGWFEQTSLTTNITDTTYHISNNPVAHYYYKVKSIDNDGLTSRWSNLQNIDLIVGLPEDDIATANLSLSQNYPNPFKNKTVIVFNLKNETNVKINVYDMLGQKVKTLLNKNMQAGKHEVSWNGCNETGVNLPKGFYFYRLESGNYSQTQKMLLLN